MADGAPLPPHTGAAAGGLTFREGGRPPVGGREDKKMSHIRPNMRPGKRLYII